MLETLSDSSNMAEDTEKPKLVQIAEHLERHGVEFLVIGGQAGVLHGSPLPTFDVDLCYRRTAENLARLAEALKALRPTLRVSHSALTSPSTPVLVPSIFSVGWNRLGHMKAWSRGPKLWISVRARRS